MVRASSDSDIALVAALQAGDHAVVTQLVTDLTPAMLRLARAHTATGSAAEDVVQDAWVTVLTSVDRFEGRSALRTWVLGIVVNKARRSAARERRTVPLSAAWRAEREDLRAPAVDADRFAAPGGEQQPGTWLRPPSRWDLRPEDAVSATELRAVFERALAALPDQQRTVVTARDVLGLSGEDVRALYGLSDGNQRVLLHRGRAKVRCAVETYVTEGVTGGETDRAGSAMTTGRPAGGLRPGSRRRLGRPAPGQAVVCQHLVELVDDYLEGALERDLRRRVEEHLAGCDDCSGYVEQVQRLLDLTRRLVDPAPTELLTRLVAAVRGVAAGGGGAP